MPVQVLRLRTLKSDYNRQNTLYIQACLHTTLYVWTLPEQRLYLILRTENTKVTIMKLFAESQIQLIDRVKLALNADSFYRVSKVLGISEPTLSRAYKNLHFLSDYNIVLLCDVSGLDAMKTLACIRVEEAKTKGNTQVAEFWQKHSSAA